MESMGIAIVVVALIMFAAFNQLLRNYRRQMIHKERLAALEKGVELPSFEQESPKRMSWNVQQLLLLAGLVWISIGVGAAVVLSAVIVGQRHTPLADGLTPVPEGLQFIGVPLILIGVSHLIVYVVGRARDRDR
jgi:hypothetical protein